MRTITVTTVTVDAKSLTLEQLAHMMQAAGLQVRSEEPEMPMEEALAEIERFAARWQRRTR